MIAGCNRHWKHKRILRDTISHSHRIVKQVDCSCMVSRSVNTDILLVQDWEGYHRLLRIFELGM